MDWTSVAMGYRERNHVHFVPLFDGDKRGKRGIYLRMVQEYESEIWGENGAREEWEGGKGGREEKKKAPLSVMLVSLSRGRHRIAC